MARGKKAKVGGKSAGTPRHRNPSNHSFQSPKTPRSNRGGWTSDEDLDDAPFSMRAAAQARGSGSFRGGSGFGSGMSLRQQSISFVRSTDPTPVKQDENRDPKISMQEEANPRPAVVTPAISKQVPQPTSTNISTKPAPIVFAPSQAPIKGPTQAPRAPSPSPSVSGDEVVLFRGRSGPLSKAPSPAPAQQSVFLPQAKLPVKNVDTLPEANKTAQSYELLPGEQASNEPTATQQPDAHDGVNQDEDDSAGWEDEKDAASTSEHELAKTASHKLSGKGKAVSRSMQATSRMPNTVSRPSKRETQGPVSKKDRAIEAALADYVENMKENGDDLENMFEGSDLSEDRTNIDGWNSSDLEDFDELSTSEELLEVVEHVLNKRHRPSGLQYLIVWDGQGVDEARWIPHAQLNMPGAAELIVAFEEKAKNTPDYDDEESDDDDDDEDEDGEEDEDEDEDSDDDIDSGDDDEAFADEVDLIERRQARLDDEKLARLFAKQEALGLGSDELMLFDQAFAANDPAEYSDGFMPFGRASRQKGRKAGRKQRKLDLLPDDLNDMDLDDSENDILDEILGDADNANLNSFDITDRSRASISRRAPSSRKDRRNDPLTWGLSDSDQATALRDSWAADRSKKAAKKREREELRQAGLLGKKNKFKPDLKARYNEGMSLTQLGRELEDFLLNDDMQSRALPPMDKRDRKTVHEIAAVFQLKSLSKGSGKQRFPVLQKTGKTIDFSEELFGRLRSQVERRFYGRLDKKGKSPKAPSTVPRRSGGGGARADNGYRDGDVVGANAPVLGVENRGRAMLEKMGWSMGMSIGKDGNGILQPIAHVVKNSRAGLG